MCNLGTLRFQNTLRVGTDEKKEYPPHLHKTSKDFSTNFTKDFFSDLFRHEIANVYVLVQAQFASV